MGFKKPTPKKKNKGPKGKKARAKALSDRQWGEIVDDNEIKKASKQRRGTTTTKKTTRNNNNDYEEEKVLQPPSFQEKILQHKQNQWEEKSATSSGLINRWNAKKSQLLENDIRREQQQQQNSSADENDQDNDDEDDDDDSDTEMETLPITNLLQSIHKTTKKRQKQLRKQHQAALIEEDDEEEEEDTEAMGEDDDEEETDDVSMASSSAASDDDDDDDDEEVDDTDTKDRKDKIDNDDDDSMTLAAASAVDIFGQRFSSSAAHDQQVVVTTKVSDPSSEGRTTTTKKLPMEKIPILHAPNLELQISSSPYKNKNDTNNNITDLLRQTSTTSTTGTATPTLLQPPTLEQWQGLSEETFTGNRQVLQRQWELFNNNSNNGRNNKKKKKKKKESQSILMTANQSYLYPFLARYTDLLVTTNDYESSSSSGSVLPKNRDEWHRLYLLHVLNHILTARGRVQRHNKQIKAREDAQIKARAEAEAKGDEENDDDEKEDKVKKNKNKKTKVINDADDNIVEDEVDEEKWRDQGFTRPTVLVLLPTRGVAYRFVQDMLELLGTKESMNQEYMERFEADYGAIVEEGDDDKGHDEDDDKERRRKAVLERKGSSWLELFGDNANQDDDFKMGISLTPKAVGGGTKKGLDGANPSSSSTSRENSNVSVRLYSDFYKSDIILASPLGLKMLASTKKSQQKATNNDNDEDDDDDEGTGDYDYLSSIEICLVQYADVLMMQNWDHVNDVLSVLNQQPQKNNDTDFSRVRNYCLEGQAAHWRQLILSSHIMDPSILSTFTRHAKSISGSMKLRRRIAPEDSSVSSVLVPIRQVFQRVTTSSLPQQGEARIKYFLSSILPAIQRQKQTHTMVYVPSYFDFCALRNIFLKRKTSFVSVTEYSRVTETSRARARFLQGRTPIMLYTGRAHFFLRHAIRGVKHLIFLGLPEHGEFYADQVNHLMLSSTSSGTTDESLASTVATVASCLSVFTKYDAHSLERIVGTSNCHRMVSSDKSTFMFQS